jgi:hypothetical protein
MKRSKHALHPSVPAAVAAVAVTVAVLTWYSPASVCTSPQLPADMNKSQQCSAEHSDMDDLVH